MDQGHNMEKVFTLSHKVIVPTDFTGFVSLSEMGKTAVLFDLVSTVNGLEALSIQQGKKINYLSGKIKSLKMASRPQEQGTEPPTTDTATEVDKVSVSTEEKATDPTGIDKRSEGATLGKKIGKTSKYHFVNVQMHNDKFRTFKASTTINKKTVGMGTSKNEIQCALFADKFLDEIGDKKRPRNRNDFPEIMTAYKVANER